MAPLLTESLFWVAAVACAVAQVAILRAVVGAGGESAGPPPDAAGRPLQKRTAPRLVEAAWALLPGVALAFVLVWTWHTVHAVHHPTPPSNSQALITSATRA